MEILKDQDNCKWSSDQNSEIYGTSSPALAILQPANGKAGVSTSFRNLQKTPTADSPFNSSNVTKDLLYRCVERRFKVNKKIVQQEHIQERKEPSSCWVFYGYHKQQNTVKHWTRNEWNRNPYIQSSITSELRKERNIQLAHGLL